MAPGRADTLPLVIDLRRCLEELLQPVSTVQRAGSPEMQDILYFFRDVDIPVRRNFLLYQLHREDRFEVIRSHRFMGNGMEGGIQRRWHVRLDIIPLRWHLLLFEQDLGLHAKYLSCTNIYIVEHMCLHMLFFAHFFYPGK